MFFSFKWDPDVWRANILRNAARIQGATSVGYWDDSLYERSLARNPDYIKRKIREGLNGTSVTIIVVSDRTIESSYVKYEYEKSIEMGNKILQIDVSNMNTPIGYSNFNGWLPYIKGGYTVKWFKNCPLGDWIEYTFRNG
ncbi:MAG: TIR domain-containing protein [Promethearchaeota archaeon]